LIVLMIDVREINSQNKIRKTIMLAE